MCSVLKRFIKTKITGYRDIAEGDEKEILRILSTVGPVSIGIDSSPKEIEFYKSGILDITTCSQTSLDHAVIAVGYDLTAPIPFLIVKNRYLCFYFSWGKGWGEQGYFRVRLYKNMCGIATDSSYPIV